MVLGIDQSLTGTAVCRLQLDGTVTVLVTIYPGKRRGAERLNFIRGLVAPYLPEVKAAAIEGYSYGSVGRVFELGEIGGVLRELMFEAGVPFTVVPPSTLKKYATSNAAAEKDQMVEAAKGEGAYPEDDNQADAFFLAHVAHALLTGAPPKTRSRLEVLKQLRDPTPKKPRRRSRKLVPTAL